MKSTMKFVRRWKKDDIYNSLTGGEMQHHDEPRSAPDGRRRPAQSIPEKPEAAPGTEVARRRPDSGKSLDQDLHGMLGIALRAFADLRLTGDARSHHGTFVLVQFVKEPLPD